MSIFSFNFSARFPTRFWVDFPCLFHTEVGTRHALQFPRPDDTAGD